MLSALQIFIGGVYHLQQLYGQSLFLFPILVRINLNMRRWDQKKKKKNLLLPVKHTPVVSSVFPRYASENEWGENRFRKKHKYVCVCFTGNNLIHFFNRRMLGTLYVTCQDIDPFAGTLQGHDHVIVWKSSKTCENWVKCVNQQRKHAKMERRVQISSQLTLGWWRHFRLSLSLSLSLSLFISLSRTLTKSTHAQYTNRLRD